MDQPERERKKPRGTSVTLHTGPDGISRVEKELPAGNPLILDGEAGEEASVRSGSQLRRQWIEEAEAAIRRVQPSCAPVAEAIRRPLILGQHGLLTAQLVDGSEWVIGSGAARPLSVPEKADWATLPESFPETH